MPSYELLCPAFNFELVEVLEDFVAELAEHLLFLIVHERDGVDITWVHQRLGVKSEHPLGERLYLVDQCVKSTLERKARLVDPSYLAVDHLDEENQNLLEHLAHDNLDVFYEL